MTPQQLVHGRASTYNNYKCRCDECRKAWADYIREGGYVRRYQEKKRKEREAEKLQKQSGYDILTVEIPDGMSEEDNTNPWFG